MMRALLCLVATLSLLLHAPLAFAQPKSGDGNVDAARAAEAEARNAFRNKKYREAAEGFAAAFRLDPRANTKYNEALAWKKADELAAAADAYEAALTFGGMDPKLEKNGSDALAGLKTKLGRLVVKQPLGTNMSVAHADKRGIPARIHLRPGEHDVTVHFTDGTTAHKTVSIVAAADTAVEFEAPEATTEPDVDKPEPKEPVEADKAMTIAGWSLVGLGAAGLVAMGVTGALTLSKVSKYDDTGNSDVELHDEAVMLKTTTNVLLGIGGGLAAVGVVLLVIDSVSGDEAAAWMEPTPSGILFRF